MKPVSRSIATDANAVSVESIAAPTRLTRTTSPPIVEGSTLPTNCPASVYAVSRTIPTCRSKACSTCCQRQAWSTIPREVSSSATVSSSTVRVWSRWGSTPLKCGVFRTRIVSTTALTRMRSPTFHRPDGAAALRAGSGRTGWSAACRDPDYGRRGGVLRVPRATMMSTIREVAIVRITTDDGVELAVEVAGSGPGLLLVHGHGGAKEDFADHVERLARRHTVVTFDHRGHGASGGPSGAESYSLARLRADTWAVADAVGFDRFRVLGHSMGGMVVRRMPLEHPERVEALVLMDTSAGTDSRARARARRGRGRDRDHAGQGRAQARCSTRPARSTRPRTSARSPSGPAMPSSTTRKWDDTSVVMWGTLAVEIVHQHDDLARLRDVTCPTLVIVGEQDEPFLDASRAMAATIPGAQLAVSAGCRTLAAVRGARRLDRRARRLPRGVAGSGRLTVSRRSRRTAAGSRPRSCRAHGVDVVFTLSGGHLFVLYDGCVQAGIDLVDTRHEQTAAFAAEGFAKVTGRPGVAALTAGPGVTNGVSAIASARLAGSPLVVLGGRAPQGRWGRGSLQELDHVPIVASVTKSAATAAPGAGIVAAVDGALRAARTPHRGPTFVDMPLDAFGPAAVEIPAFDAETTRGVAPDPDAVRARRSTGRDRGTAGARRWRRRVLGGSGRRAARVRGAGGRARVRERPRARNARRGPSPRVLAAAGRVEGRRPRRRGRDTPRLPPRVRCVRRRAGRAPRGRPGEIGTHAAPAEAIGADLRATFAALAETSGGAGTDHEDWTETLRAEEQRVRDGERDRLGSDAVPIVPPRVYGELRALLDRDAIVIGDGGDFVSYAGKYVDTYVAGSFLDPGPYGCLGTGPGYALGARAARPGRQLVLMLGDGAAGFSLGDLDTLVRHHVDVTIVVGNNGIWGLEKHPMQALFGYDVVADLRPEHALRPRHGVARRARRAGPRAGRAAARARPRVRDARPVTRQRAHRPRRRLPAQQQSRIEGVGGRERA